ncbi:uncharacterized protein LOC128728992, partial [Anopheles nili]|uniref:uncharacterized protein LOC128728992 n=1 Tax=Anopheles nili TaxID=185578 RepID=UPI00237A3CFD
CKCLCFTPFIFYVSSKKAMEFLSPILKSSHNFFCVNCLPKPDPAKQRVFYRDESLFNNLEFLSIFKGYEYSNPYDDRYFSTDRVIITEHAKIYPEIRKMATKPKPFPRKLKTLLKIFPAVHRLPFNKYLSLVDMYEDIIRKENEIRSCYRDRSLNTRLSDKFDIMVDRTTLHLRISSRTERKSQGDSASQKSSSIESFLTDILVARDPPSSSSSSSSMTRASPPESLGITDSEPGNVSSQQYSTQDSYVWPESPRPSNVTLQKSPRGMSLESTAQTHRNPEEGEFSGFRRPRPQEDKETTSAAKRRRLSIPMNPTPQEIQSGPPRTQGARVPRVPGG